MAPSSQNQSQPVDESNPWDMDAFAAFAGDEVDGEEELDLSVEDVERALAALSGNASKPTSNGEMGSSETIEDVPSDDVAALLQAVGVGNESNVASSGSDRDQAARVSSDSAIQPAELGTLDDEELADAFVQDASRGIAILEQAVIDLESGEDTAEPLASICRELHTVKGAASTVGLSDVGRYLHEVEDYVQAADNPTAGQFIEMMIACTDTIQRQVNLLTGRGPVDEDTDSDVPSENPPKESLGRIDPVADSEDAISVKASQLDRLLDMLTALVMLRNQRESRVDALRRVSDEVNRCGSRLREVERRFTAEFESDVHELRVENHSNPLREIANDLLEIKNNLRATYDPVAAENAAVSDFIRQFRQALVTLLRMPVSGLFRRLQRAALDAARVEEKKIRLEVEGADVGLERSVQERLFEPLLHIIRNSVGHGIETPSEREAVGKDPTGTITLEATGNPNVLVLSIRDDGKGLNYEAIKKRGLEKGLLSPDKEPTEAELAQLIFQRGFSTRDTTNSVAGRGIGMDVVADTLDRMQAWIDVSSVSGKGTTITLTIPLRSLIEHSMVVRAGGQLFALPMASLKDAKSNTTNESVAIDDLANALGIVSEPDTGNSTSQEAFLTVETPDSSQLMRLRVDEVVGPEEVVVRPLPPILRQQKLFSGVTLSGDGEVVLVIDPARLAAIVLDQEFRPAAPATRAKQLQHILVVDDSLSARRAASNLWQKAGYQTTECADGPAALQTLSSGVAFDALVTDFDMPGMTGLELIQAVREDTQFDSLPIFMLSSRTPEEMESTIIEAGAALYLQKPITEEKLRSAIAQLQSIN